MPIGAWYISPAFSSSVMLREQVIDPLIDRPARVLVAVEPPVPVQVAVLHVPPILRPWRSAI